MEQKKALKMVSAERQAKTRKEIAERAYELYAQRTSLDPDQLEAWYEAERRLDEELEQLGYAERHGYPVQQAGHG